MDILLKLGTELLRRAPRLAERRFHKSDVDVRTMPYTQEESIAMLLIMMASWQEAADVYTRRMLAQSTKLATLDVI